MAAILDQSRSIPRDQWITPQEQLQRLEAPVGDERLTYWHTALEKLHALPNKIPPLVRHIRDIFSHRCPVYGDEKQKDGTFLTTGDTHILMLVQEEFKTLNHLGSMTRNYGRILCDQDPNPFCIRYGDASDKGKYGTIPFQPTHWVLMLKYLLKEDSTEEAYYKQAARVDKIRAKRFIDYQVPPLQDAAVTMLLYKVATGVAIYPQQATRVFQTESRWESACIGFNTDVGVLIADPAISSVDGECIAYCSHDPDVGTGALRVL